MQLRKMFQEAFAIATNDGTLAVFFAVVDNSGAKGVVKFRLPETIDSFLGVVIRNRTFDASLFGKLVKW